MGRETGISWTDATFNPWWGCTKVSPGCDNCYAEAVDARFGGSIAGGGQKVASHWGKGAPRRIFGEGHWRHLRTWQAEAARTNTRIKVFVASMADVMDDEAPEGQRARLWAAIDESPNLDFQLLTKRPHRYARYLPEDGFIWDNVWLGATAENQSLYDVRMTELAKAAAWLLERNRISSHDTTIVPKPVPTFISYEPAIGPVTIGLHKHRPDWIIFGGETGQARRPMDRMWADALEVECRVFGVRLFVKQMSAATPADAAALIPAELLIRQFPGEAR